MYFSIVNNLYTFTLISSLQAIGYSSEFYRITTLKELKLLKFYNRKQLDIFFCFLFDT